MSVYQRQHVSTLLARLDESPERLIIISGPRQTGKTTLVRQALAQLNIKRRYISIDQPELHTFTQSLGNQDKAITHSVGDEREKLIRVWEEARQDADREWEKISQSTDRSKRSFVLVLDEIQKIPQWSETVKGLWDADRATGRPMHVVLLGSAPLLMQQGLTESLAGRFELIRVNHWSFLEMVDAFGFDLSSYIYFGGYPGAARYVNDQPRWRDYVRSSLIEPNIERDVLSMTRVDKPALLKRAFELGSSYSGQILAYDKMRGQLQDAGNVTTLARYLDLLSSAGLLTALPMYAGQQHRRRASRPKFNVLNTSFMAVNSGYSFEEAKADRTFWGRMVESAVGAHLFNTGMPDIGLYYWRESSQEVDFVMERDGKLISIEVKSGSGSTNSSGLSAFQMRFAPQRSLLVGERGIPVDEFLTQPAAYWFDSE